MGRKKNVEKNPPDPPTRWVHKPGFALGGGGGGGSGAGVGDTKKKREKVKIQKTKQKAHRGTHDLIVANAANRPPTNGDGRLDPKKQRETYGAF